MIVSFSRVPFLQIPVLTNRNRKNTNNNSTPVQLILFKHLDGRESQRV